MKDTSPKPSKKIKSLKDLYESGKHLNGDSGNSHTIKPEWFDRNLLNQAYDFCRDYTMMILISYQYIIVTGLTIPRLLKPLIWTGQSSTAETSKVRYARVAMHLIDWLFDEDNKNCDPFDYPNNKKSVSIHKTRLIHRVNRKLVNKGPEEGGRGLQNPSKQNKGSFLSMYDMAWVQAAFVTPPLLFPRTFNLSKQEKKAWVHLWRTIGYLLGIDEEHNICSSVEQAETIVYDIVFDEILPGLKTPPKEYKYMADAFCEGYNLFLQNSPIPHVITIELSTFMVVGIFYQFLQECFQGKSEKEIDEMDERVKKLVPRTYQDWPEWLKQERTYKRNLQMRLFLLNNNILLKSDMLRSVSNKLGLSLVHTCIERLSEMDMGHFRNAVA